MTWPQAEEPETEEPEEKPEKRRKSSQSKADPDPAVTGTWGVTPGHIGWEARTFVGYLKH